jgi:uncharacterized protein (DUF427 family)
MATPVKPNPAPGFKKNPGKLLEIEPSARRVRVRAAGQVIADTTNARLMREGGHLPVYYIPMADLRMDLFTRTDHHSHCPYKGDASYWSLKPAGDGGENVMWAYCDPFDECLPIKDHAALYWDRMESWWEEDEEVFRHPRDPKHRVDAILSHRPVKVVLGGETVAETENAVFVFETGHPVRYYIPEADVQMDMLTPTATRTRCPYKGEANYFSATIGGEMHDDIVWRYSDPLDECPKIRGTLCFFHENVDAIFVDGEKTETPVTKRTKKAD